MLGVALVSTSVPHGMGCKFGLDTSSRDLPFLLVPRGSYDTLQPQHHAVVVVNRQIRRLELLLCLPFPPSEDKDDRSWPPTFHHDQVSPLGRP